VELNWLKESAAGLQQWKVIFTNCNKKEGERRRTWTSFFAIHSKKTRRLPHYGPEEAPTTANPLYEM